MHLFQSTGGNSASMQQTRRNTNNMQPIDVNIFIYTILNLFLDLFAVFMTNNLY